MKTILVTALAALALPLPAASQTAWYSNDFQSPTGNIRCHYNPAIEAIACGTLNDAFTVALSAYGGRPHKIFDGTVYRWKSGPVLRYNVFWTAHWLRCDSSFSGMTCRATQTGHGFFLNRTTYNRW